MLVFLMDRVIIIIIMLLLLLLMLLFCCCYCLLLCIIIFILLTLTVQAQEGYSSCLVCLSRSDFGDYWQFTGELGMNLLRTMNDL